MLLRALRLELRQELEQLGHDHSRLLTMGPVAGVGDDQRSTR
jgi:hypothetical protein